MGETQAYPGASTSEATVAVTSSFSGYGITYLDLCSGHNSAASSMYVHIQSYFTQEVHFVYLIHLLVVGPGT